MKLRIRGDSLRLRLTQPEVATLGEGGSVEESTSFGPGASLTYAVRATGTNVAATLGASRIEVTIPTATAKAWAAADDVGIEALQPASEGRTLRILVEKDFACLTKRPHEDDADAFPNPNTSCDVGDRPGQC
jgi:hypothetical protein